MRDVSVMATKTGSVEAGRRPNDFGNGATNDQGNFVSRAESGTL